MQRDGEISGPASSQNRTLTRSEYPFSISLGSSVEMSCWRRHPRPQEIHAAAVVVLSSKQYWGPDICIIFLWPVCGRGRDSAVARDGCKVIRVRNRTSLAQADRLPPETFRSLQFHLHVRADSVAVGRVGPLSNPGFTY